VSCSRSARNHRAWWVPKRLLVSAGLSIGFAPDWTTDIPNRSFVLKKVRGIDFKIGLGIAWSKKDPTPSRGDIVEIAKLMVRRG
jgi:hypothetical protein